jgi:SET domain-containing protein
MSVSLNPLFSLFNHSCEPDLDWETQRDHRTVVMRVSKNVRAGEQLFVEYDGFEHDKPVNERRQRLARWIDGLCMCSRCVREEQALLAMRSGEGQTQDGQVADVS